MTHDILTFDITDTPPDQLRHLFDILDTAAAALGATTVEIEHAPAPATMPSRILITATITSAQASAGLTLANAAINAAIPGATLLIRGSDPRQIVTVYDKAAIAALKDTTKSKIVFPANDHAAQAILTQFGNLTATADQ